MSTNMAPQAVSSSASVLDKSDTEALAQEGCFTGKHIVFWTRSHTATLKQKATQAGAILENKITELTKLVVAARDTSATDAAAHLADLPASIPLRSKKWEGRRLKIPTDVDFVVPQYISDCLVQAHILPTSAYLIALQQVATKDTRTYSNEECTVKTSDAEEVMQHTSKDSKAEPQMNVATAQGTDQGSAKASSAVNAQQESEKAPPPASLKKAELPEQPDPNQLVDSESTKKIGIYPDVDPEGRSFTGGHTGIPWGTGRSLQPACLPAWKVSKKPGQTNCSLPANDGVMLLPDGNQTALTYVDIFVHLAAYDVAQSHVAKFHTAMCSILT